jgi:Nuclease-related domain
VDKLLAIRWDDACASCGALLAAGTKAYWSKAERVVRCVACRAPAAADAGEAIVGDAEATPIIPAGWAPPTVTGTAPASVASAPSPAPPLDVAGASAQREYDRRSSKERARKEQKVAEDTQWRQAIKRERPVLGRVAAALTPKPQVGPESQPTKAWKIGAEGERRVADVLEGVPGIVVLHDRLVPASRANIDHIVVGGSGVYVIDAKKYSGKIEARDVGGLFRTDLRLYVNDRDRTKLVDAVLQQVAVVRTALGEEFAEVPVRGVLCFVGCDWGVIMRTKQVKGVTALWPLALPDHVSVAGQLGATTAAIADCLRAKLRRAAPSGLH